MDKINWNEYAKTFPDRYIKKGPFDDFISKMVRKAITILDIGGGTTGSLSPEQAYDNMVWLLDPNVTTLPKGYAGRATWYDPSRKYDLIICRGSFNYLQNMQIRSIPNILTPTGCFIFNTFLEPREIFREYTINGIKAGIEKTVVQGDSIKTIHHYLIPHSGHPIHHMFIHYPDQIISRVFFKGMYVQIKTDGNSAIYAVQQKRNPIDI